MEAETHPIDMLLELVIAEEMDPWEIDIEDITDKFLEKIRDLTRINLRVSGKTLLTSSILLRMKSEKIGSENGNGWKEEWVEGIEELGWAWDVSNKPRELLEGKPVLKIPLRRRPEGKFTLFELVGALQRSLGEEMIRRSFPHVRRVRESLKMKVEEEDIEAKIERMHKRIIGLSKIQSPIKFSSLLNGSAKKDMIHIILSLLYLDSRSKIKIWQPKLFGEIFISLR